MSETIRADHPLRQLFREATSWAFRFGEFEAPEARDAVVRGYLADDLLVRFLRAESLYRLKTARGKPLADVAEMLLEGVSAHGRSAALEIQRHIGDYTLFVSGLFPESLARLRRKVPEAPADTALMQVGNLLLSFDNPADYYQEEGRRAYYRAAEIGRELDPKAAELFEKLSRFFRTYVRVLALLRSYLDASSAFAEAKRIIL